MNAADEALTFASAYIKDGVVVHVHYARCEPCMGGQHEGGRHDWAGPEDIEHAAAAGQPDPTGQVCGCYCTSEPPQSPDEPDFDSSLDQEVCALCGEVGACAYDSEGRPLIHATAEDDDT